MGVAVGAFFIDRVHRRKSVLPTPEEIKRPFTRRTEPENGNPLPMPKRPPHLKL
jgi:hypothetical protein